MSSPLTTHVLDTARGCPAAGIPITLEIADEDGFMEVASGETDDDGRIRDLLKPGTLEARVYRITFWLDAWYRSQGTEAFYPHARVVFRVTDPDQHHHIPLLLSPYGYSTYRGS